MTKCYGCGRQYDPLDEEASTEHSRHWGDSGYPRERLLELVNTLQAERDAALRSAARVAQ